MALTTDRVDVVVCGGGPVGLLTGYCLEKLGVSTIVLEQYDKSVTPMSGRACTMYPRSLELLDSYGLLHDLVQDGYIGRGSVTFDKNGKRVTSRGWNAVFTAAKGSFHDYCLNLRLKYIEDIIRAKYLAIGGVEAAGWEVTHLLTHDSSSDDRNVVVTATQTSTGSVKTFQGRYVVGADGNRSIVRREAGIDMPEDGSTYRWVRVDGVLEHNMPDGGMGFASLENPNYGNVLFCRIDHDRTRIGFNIDPKLLDKLGDPLTEEQAAQEAVQAILPWKAKWKCIDWHTTYKVKQALATTFVKGKYLLAGDAAHLHSSAAAQGLNTGIHDATNLAWKLAGVIKGRYPEAILETYNLERRTAAETLISLDKKFSALISGVIPPELATAPQNGTVKVDVNALFRQVFSESIGFNVGLGISYAENVLNVSPTAGMIEAGHRAPDHLLYAPGSQVPVRLQSILAVESGHFNIIVFAGEPILTSPKLQLLRKYLDEAPSSILKTFPASNFRFLTMIVGNKPDGNISIGTKRFGDLWYDRDSKCHIDYSIAIESGGVIVVRPDGLVGFGTHLDTGEELTAYFDGFMIKAKSA